MASSSAGGQGAQRTGPALESMYRFVLWLVPTVEKVLEAVRRHAEASISPEHPARRGASSRRSAPTSPSSNDQGRRRRAPAVGAGVLPGSASPPS